MKFTAEFLNLCAVLTIIHLYLVTARPPCNLERLAKMEKEHIAHILKEYVPLNGKDLEPLEVKFSQLHIHSGSIDEKKLDAVCGVNYTIYALKSIYKHQEQLNHKKTDFLQNLDRSIRSLEGSLKPCLEKFLSTSCQKHAKPEFPEHSEHYKRKQWSLAALQHVEKFFEELIKFLQNKHLHLE